MASKDLFPENKGIQNFAPLLIISYFVKVHLWFSLVFVAPSQEQKLLSQPITLPVNLVLD